MLKKKHLSFRAALMKYFTELENMTDNHQFRQFFWPTISAFQQIISFTLICWVSQYNEKWLSKLSGGMKHWNFNICSINFEFKMVVRLVDWWEVGWAGDWFRVWAYLHACRCVYVSSHSSRIRELHSCRQVDCRLTTT